MNESMRSVTIARKIDRPSAKQFINEMFDGNRNTDRTYLRGQCQLQLWTAESGGIS